MKNRKFIKTIIFSLLLLLCVCVPFLVHKNNVKAETEITDLTNSEWIINETLVLNENLGQNESKSFSITGTYNSFDDSSNLIELPISSITSYRYSNISTIQINCPEEISPYTFNVYYTQNSSISLTGDIRVSYTTSHSLRFYGSSNTNYEKLRTFTITGGNDVNNQELISFISTNATQVNIPEEPVITDLTNTIWNLNDTISSLVDINLVYNIDFFVNDGTTDISYNSIKFDYGAIAYGNNGVYTEVYNDTLGWLDTYYKNITITGGNDVTDQTLIQWFVDNNATFSGGSTPEPEPDPVYTISGQYRFNEEITWLYDTSEQEGVLYLPFYVYNLDNVNRVNYDYIVNQYDAIGDNYLMYANETASGTFAGQYAGTFTTSTTVRMLAGEEIVYFYTAEVSELAYNWLNENGQFTNDPILDPNNPENPDSGNNPNNPNNPDFGTDTVRQIVNQVNAFLGIQILPGLSFRDILLICIALPLLIYILKVFLGG